MEYFDDRYWDNSKYFETNSFDEIKEFIKKEREHLGKLHSVDELTRESYMVPFLVKNLDIRYDRKEKKYQVYVGYDIAAYYENNRFVYLDEDDDDSGESWYLMFYNMQSRIYIDDGKDGYWRETEKNEFVIGYVRMTELDAILLQQ